MKIEDFHHPSAMRLDRHKHGAADLLRAHHPAGEFGNQRGLALAALAAHNGIGFLVQQPLQSQQFAAAADEAGLWWLGQLTQAVFQSRLPIGLRLPGRGGAE